MFLHLSVILSTARHPSGQTAPPAVQRPSGQTAPTPLGGDPLARHPPPGRQPPPPRRPLQRTVCILLECYLVNLKRSLKLPMLGHPAQPRTSKLFQKIFVEFDEHFKSALRI